MKVSLPASVTAQMAETATVLAQQNAISRGWKSSDSMTPTSGVGYYGIQAGRKYYLYQERGTKPYVMWGLEGKIIPIHDASGTHFIRATGVGQPGYVTLPGGIKKWRDQKWRHPGLKPTNLMGESIEKAPKQNRAPIVAMLQQLIGYDVDGGLG